MTNRLILFVLVFALSGALVPASKDAHAASPYVTLAELQPGMLIRGTTLPAVYYYGRDGLRYVFVNEKTYGTWYDNFDTVKWLTDADLGSVQIGGNVTYRPGKRMIKIDTDPKVYAIGQGGALHWVSTESVAIALYGANWNKMIDDMPDGFYGNYKQSSEITAASQFVPASVTASVPDINTDKSLVAPAVVTISATAYNPILVNIAVGGNVKWTNTDSQNHTVTSDDLTWGSGTMSAGKSFIKTFKKAGTYTYFDSYKPQLTGTVIVQ